MSRQKLFALAALIATLAVTACSDLTGPKDDGTRLCPITGGSDTCRQ
jgi:hypothetical protein